jgi:hypothetical protein
VIRALRRASDILPNAEAGTNALAMREFARGDIRAEMTAAPMRVGGRFRFHRKTPPSRTGPVSRNTIEGVVR